MSFNYPCCARQLFVALFFNLLLIPTSFATSLLPLPAGGPDSTVLAASPADASAADTARPARLAPKASVALADTSLMHPRDAQGRISTYTVAPGVTWHYAKPRPFRWLLHVPRDLGQFPGYAFRKENTSTFIGLAVSSVALWAIDQPLLEWAQDLGRTMGLSAKSTQTTLVYIPFRVGSVNLPFEFNVPDNLNSTFYYIGDGWTHLSVATGFWVYGGLKKDNRALQTASQLGEAILSTGLVVQALKRSTGRQSPFVSTKDRGEWHPFPSFSRYQSSVPKYDAFPTGHLATAMATVTVIADNYSEYRFIRPLGYSLMGLLGYSMLNNGVHWASDYPVGIALGYAFAKLAVRNGRTRVEPPLDPATQGTGMAPPPKRQPWYRQGKFAPYTYGPFTGASWSLRW
ncbi:phosphatase PAP2 family protein [Hymenobacter sp. B1770]|uniref:phosphatase PAP2 family protein n=1 Tax=Hymenobacter sp. B1770 TaxID=1718788 RepID=UPI003CF7940C